MSKPKIIPNGAPWGDYTKEDVIATFNDFVNNGKHNDELDSLRTKNAELDKQLAEAESRADSLAVELVKVCNYANYLQHIATEEDPDPNVTRCLVPKHGLVWHAINTLSARATAILDREKVGE